MDASTTVAALVVTPQDTALVPVKSATTDATMTTTRRDTNMRLSTSSMTSSCNCGFPSSSAGLCAVHGDQNQHYVLRHQHTVYFDPYTTLPQGYMPRTARWKRIFTKLQSHRRAVSSSTASSSNSSAIPSGPSLLFVAGSKLAGRGSTGAKLTVRNLEEFFDPAAYDDEMDVFKDPRDRENPFDNAKKRERVDQWIDNLP